MKKDNALQEAALWHVQYIFKLNLIRFGLPVKYVKRKIS